MLLLIFTLSMSVTSCKDDDDEPVEAIDDYYSECVSVSGGGYSAQQCARLMNMLNTDEDLELGPAYTRVNISKEQAIYYFDRQCTNIYNIFKGEGLSGVSGTLVITFALKNSKGSTIKQTRINVTSTDATMN